MNARACASSGAPDRPQVNSSWETIDWDQARAYVKKLQMRIAKAQREGNHGKVKSLQWTLTHSFYAKALAVKRVTENRGKRTAGVDGVLLTTKKAKYEAIFNLKRCGYNPQPLRRVLIPKSNGKTRPLGIPTMTDRVMQTLYKMSLEPVAETTADPNSYGFRIGRCTQDAAVQCAAILARKDRAAWVLEGDIKGCFDNISHDWIMANIPMDKEILHKFLKCGYIETGTLFPTESGTPQGGAISPTICNMVLDGLERLLHRTFRPKTANYKIHKPKVNFVRYADDFIITGMSRELLAEQVLPVVKGFMAERGLTLSEEKTLITHISEGFDFLGFNVRKYSNGKFLIKPTKKNVQAFLGKVRGMIKRNKASTQELLIKQLNPVIRGWANYHMHNASKQTFSYVDNEIWKCLWQWAKRRHPKKSATWIQGRYFHYAKGRVWNFCVPLGDPDSKNEHDFILLERASEKEIRRFTKIKSDANPFDERHTLYFEQRETEKMLDTLRGRSTLVYLYVSQKGICPICGEPLAADRGFRVHREKTGNQARRAMVHSYCGNLIPSPNSVSEPAPSQGLTKA